MQPRFVYQTEYDIGKGNCFSACLASLLGVAISEVPNFTGLEDPARIATEWVIGRGFRLVPIPFCEAHKWVALGDLVILCGYGSRRDSKGNSVRHAIIARAVEDGFEMVHDPTPNGNGLIGTPDGVYYLLKSAVDANHDDPVSKLPADSQCAAIG